MTTGHVIHAGDGRGWHIEAIRGVAACGRTFDIDADDVRREPYGNGERVDADHPHSTVCFDCVGSHGTIRPPQRGETA